ALTAATWWAGKDTKEARRLHATATTAAATGYLTVASFTDPLGRAGFKNWTPDAFEQLNMPYMIVWIEEAAKFFREGTEMEGL
ncbi:hypothetical protein KBZ21_40335, partial [Streptomyces sp. A73]|nr:hypothetical protein [Streptomyces sp. A73]